MASLQPVRGTHDILAEDFKKHLHVIECARRVAKLYGFAEMATPIFERTEVFARTLGDSSDIVTKEMYTFDDRSGDSLTLRPEYTAGIARAFMSGGLQQNLPLKVFCQGPMFRYERPQKGRLRQFHQIDIELLGVADPQADIEVIALGAQILNELGLSDRIQLELNTLGDTESRQVYRALLVDYFNDHLDKLSADSRVRLEKNPLRILDSKDEGDRAIVANAPLLSASLNQSSQDFFATLTSGLKSLGIDYTLNPRLVRGMDYYCHSAFEFTTTTLGAQGAVMAGGRYDGLVKTMGGPQTPGMGWAAGIERLVMMIDDLPERSGPITVIPIGDAAAIKALQLTQQLRGAGFTIDLGYSGNMKKRLNRANKAEAQAVLILGEDELAKNIVTLRDMKTGEQTEVTMASIEGSLARYR